MQDKLLLYTLIISPSAYCNLLSSINLGEVPLSLPFKVILAFSFPSESLISIVNATSLKLFTDNFSLLWLNTLYVFLTVSNPISKANFLLTFSELIIFKVLSPPKLILSFWLIDSLPSCILLTSENILNIFLYKLGLTVIFLFTIVVLSQRSVAV